jgi:hypothetical protein
MAPDIGDACAAVEAAWGFCWAQIGASYFASRACGRRICCLTYLGRALLRPKASAPRFHRDAADASGGIVTLMLCISKTYAIAFPDENHVVESKNSNLLIDPDFTTEVLADQRTARPV